MHDAGFNLGRPQTTELKSEKDQDGRMEAAYIIGGQTLTPGQPQVVRMGQEAHQAGGDRSSGANWTYLSS